MSRLGKIVYALALVGFAAIASLALIARIWHFAALAVLFGALFAVASPFVLGRRWHPPSPPPTRRPVIRRRR